MPSADQPVQTYRQLAEHYNEQGEAQLRDRFLILAADAAFTIGRRDEAESLCGRLLQHNPHHMLKPYASFAEALKSVDVRNYVAALRRTHPQDKSRQLLETLQPNAGAQELQPDLQRSTDNESSQSPEVLQVYCLHDDEPEAKPQPHQPRSAPRLTAAPKGRAPAAHIARPAGHAPSSSPSARPAASEPAERNRSIYPLRWETEMPAVSATPSAEAGEFEDHAGAWVSGGLFGLIVAASAFAAAYTLVRPFWP